MRKSGSYCHSHDLMWHQERGLLPKASFMKGLDAKGVSPEAPYRLRWFQCLKGELCEMIGLGWSGMHSLPSHHHCVGDISWIWLEKNWREVAMTPSVCLWSGHPVSGAEDGPPGRAIWWLELSVRGFTSCTNLLTRGFFLGGDSESLHMFTVSFFISFPQFPLIKFVALILPGTIQSPR